MENFKHIIITRFNLPKRWDSDKLGNTVLNNNWLSDRYLLFENYCLPSIKSQTNQNFEWWVYFDKNMDPYYKMKNDSIKSEYLNFIPKYEETYDDFELNMPKEISKYLISEKKDWLVTTRIDNDDMFAKNTIELIQNSLIFDGEKLLEIPFGYTLETGIKSKLRSVKSYLNPFISYTEKVSKGKTVKSVYYYQHNKWKDVTKLVVSKKEQWIQVIHNKNVCNTARGKEIYPFGLHRRFKFKDRNLRFDYLYLFIVRSITQIIKKI